MNRPVCFDVTHLVSRLGIPWPSGIDKVDLAYGRHFSERGLGPFLRYASPRPQIVSQAEARGIIDRCEAAHWQQAKQGPDQAFLKVQSCLTGTKASPSQLGVITSTDAVGRRKAPIEWIFGGWRRQPRHIGSPGVVPEGAIYLNVSQHIFENAKYFEWLHERRDVRSVFLLHDLLPLDYPEFFRAGEAVIFERRLTTALTHGSAFIVTTNAVRQRIEAELVRRNRKAVPMFVAPLPSSLVDVEASDLADTELAAVPYFVIVGTIEPRKNHLFLLAVWRALCEGAVRNKQSAPKLVIVGGRGWENEQVLDILDRGRATQPHVLETSGLSSLSLARLIANARALLMPSFDEGYGLPLVEALTLGTPVVATDAPVFREVTQGCAIYRSAIDGLGWQGVIQSLTDRTSDSSREARALAGRFRAPQWPQYFDNIERFLATL